MDEKTRKRVSNERGALGVANVDEPLDASREVGDQFGSFRADFAITRRVSLRIDAVSRRRREFGLRAALGASQPRIVAALVAKISDDHLRVRH